MGLVPLVRHLLRLEALSFALRFGRLALGQKARALMIIVGAQGIDVKRELGRVSQVVIGSHRFGDISVREGGNWKFLLRGFGLG